MTLTMKPMRKRVFNYALLMSVPLLVLGSGKAMATDFHSLDDIRSTAEAYVQELVEESSYKTIIETGYLDTRLRLAKCTTPLTGKQLSAGSRIANTTISVSCESGKRWTVYVPVRVKQYVQAVIATAPLGRKQPIRAENLRLVEKELSTITRGYYKDPQTLVGKLPKRPLSNGTVIAPSDLTAGKVISRGQRVTIVAKNGDISIKVPGKAMSDAGQGEPVKVQNISSQRTVEGIATAPGIVTIPM